MRNARKINRGRLLTAALIVLVAALALLYVEDAKGASANSTCYALRGTMADGSYTRHRSVAMNNLPLGSKIRLTGRSFYGYRIFYVRDRIGWGSELDFWSASNSTCTSWGRRTVTYRVVRYGR